VVNCEECLERCKHPSRFEVLYFVAGLELVALQKQRPDLEAEIFWQKIDEFFERYPHCVIEALEEATMEIYHRKYHG